MLRSVSWEYLVEMFLKTNAVQKTLAPSPLSREAIAHLRETYVYIESSSGWVKIYSVA